MSNCGTTNVKFQLRRDLSENWAGKTLLPGEPAFSTDTNGLKIGPGLWNELPYIGGSGPSGPSGPQGEKGDTGIAFTPTTLQLILPVLYPSGTSSYDVITNGFVRGDVIDPSTGARGYIGFSNLLPGQAVYFLNSDVIYHGFEVDITVLTRFTIYYIDSLDTRDGYARLRLTETNPGDAIIWIN